MHRRTVGVSNEGILENARRLRERNVVVRVPLIPGITDTEENVAAIVSFMRDVGFPRAELLPFNPASGAKYEWLGREYGLRGEPQNSGSLARVRDMFKQARVEAEIVE